MNEHPERIRDVTEHVIAWITTDVEHREQAAQLAHNNTTAVFAVYMRSLLHWSPKGSAAWRAAQELAPADYKRIDWQAVTSALGSHPR